MEKWDRLAIAEGLKDNTKTGFVGRLERLENEKKNSEGSVTQ